MRTTLFILSLATFAAAPLAAQADSATTRKEVIYIEPAEGDYVGMIVGATAWARQSIAKSLGVLQREDAPVAWKRGIEAAAKQYDLKTIALNDFTMSCYTRQASRSTPASRVCSMKGADAVLQFNTLRVAGDTGAMVTTVTQVPKNASGTKTTHYCVTLARSQGTSWSPLRSAEVADPDKCVQ